jgi:hypothetical protein
MKVSEIIDVIRNDKRFSSYNYKIDFDSRLYSIECLIGKTTYKILVEEKQNYKINFVCDLYGNSLSDIVVVLSRTNCSERYILSKFSEVIKYLKKVNFFISKKNLHISKIKPFILDFIKNEYSLEFDDNKFNMFRFDFPQTCYRVRRKLKQERFNVKKEKKNTNIEYKIYVSVANDTFFSHTFYFDYVENNNLILTLRTENYRRPIDLTRVIRSEKLKNLMLCECE